MHAKNNVYKAEIKSGNDLTTKTYIRMTSNTFKERYRNHIKSIKHTQYSSETELSKYVWNMRKNNTQFTIKWSTSGTQKPTLLAQIVATSVLKKSYKSSRQNQKIY